MQGDALAADSPVGVKHLVVRVGDFAVIDDDVDAGEIERVRLLAEHAARVAGALHFADTNPQVAEDDVVRLDAHAPVANLHALARCALARDGEVGIADHEIALERDVARDGEHEGARALGLAGFAQRAVNHLFARERGKTGQQRLTLAGARLAERIDERTPLALAERDRVRAGLTVGAFGATRPAAGEVVLERSHDKHAAAATAARVATGTFRTGKRERLRAGETRDRLGRRQRDLDVRRAVGGAGVVGDGHGNAIW